ncbi:MAG: quinolinate synthase NadA [Chloroflexi bacterium]|nr:quinolinate synthase NadA [Chloroflexota bacterium]
MLPDEYRTLPERELLARIAVAKEKLGPDLVILGHHYQREEVIRFADHLGDSLELSRVAAAQREARYIVFCGVDFMAETAAMLCDPSQTVLLPAMEAPCPMARMADVGDALTAWDALTARWGEDALLPITYQNSTAALKAFCGQRDGAVCTSANAQQIFRWALDQGRRILFFPDEWLGRNTALALGIPPQRIAVWDPAELDGGCPDVGEAQVMVWKGYCHIHTYFTVEHVRAVRQRYGDITVVVHPECTVEVVRAADLNGSTSFILRTVRDASPGSQWAVGTEINMVARLAQEYPDRTVVPLARSLCGAMYRTNLHNLLYTLEELLHGRFVGQVQVPAETARWANLALERMLRL